MGETVTLNVKLRAFVRKETKQRWVVVCPAIGIASQGTSAEDAKQSLHEAVEAWFESCVERGVLDQALRESNFRPVACADEAAAYSEHVLVNRVQTDEEEDVRGAVFNIAVTIPAYQAATFLAANA